MIQCLRNEENCKFHEARCLVESNLVGKMIAVNSFNNITFKAKLKVILTIIRISAV